MVYQSAVPPTHRQQSLDDVFEVSVLSHLRDVKDPLRAAFAARSLPPQSRIRIVHAGQALGFQWEERARTEERMNARYRWLGERSHDDAMQLLARSRLMILSSTMEGGASAIAESVACRVPVLCSDIPGNVGMLGPNYPGYFRVKDTTQLAALLGRAETDPKFLASLQESLEGIRSRFTPEQERESWACVLEEL